MKYINTIIIIFLSIFFSFSQPNFCFKSQESYSTIVPWNLITSAASNVSFLEKGDFNKDGKLDYAFTVANNKVITYTGTGLGTFSLSNTYTLGSSGILPITSGDYNNDTNLDLIVASNFSNDITLLSGDGAGNFSISPIFTPTSQPRNLITDDVNNDGNKDLITFANDVLISLGNGNGNFNTPIALSSFVGLEGVCVDINNDSNKDLVIQSAGTLRIHLGNGAGNFTYTGGFPTGYSGWCTGIVSKDFNTDGNADIAIATGTNNQVFVMLGNGIGNFSAPITYSVGSNPFSLLSEDLNNDGILDLITSNYTSGDISILFGNGTGGFSPSVKYTVDDKPGGMEIGDFTNDGKNDILISCANGHILHFPQKAGGYFGPNIFYRTPNFANIDLSNDFNNDGMHDLIGAIPTNTNISIGLGDGTGNFSPSANPTNIMQSSDMCSKDFNNDGIIDLAVVSGTTVGVYFGNGLGTFSGFTSYSLTANSNLIIEGDLNNDGNLDLIISGVPSSGAKISVLMGSLSGVFTPGAGVSLFQSPYSAMTKGDFNNDGKLDIALAFGPIISGPSRILIGNGTGGFTIGSTITTIGGFYNIASGDLNNDGNIDLVLSSGTAIWSFIGTGLGTFPFTPLTPTLNIGNHNSMILSDFNADGNLDISFNRFGGLYVYKGDGLGNFSNQSYFLHDYGGMSDIKSMVDIDINKDGLMDLAISSGTTSSYSMHPLINVSPAIIAPPFCVGTTSIVLRGPKGATSYSWSPSGSTADSLIITGAGTYSLTINNYWGCSGTAVKTISISPNPVVTISSPSLLCTGNSATISASGATSYTWSNGVNSLYTVVNPTISTNYTVTGQNSSGCKSSAAVTLSVSTCTGIEELNTYDFRIYPNPANESITIRSTINEKFLLSIYTALGNKCLETNLNGSETNINISGLTAGIYFIRIQTSKGEINRKLIKE